jgi:SAM-dependent methyltransferase
VDDHGSPLRPSATLPVRGPTSGSSRRTERGSGPGDIQPGTGPGDIQPGTGPGEIPPGTGPGEITPDGCSVELYALLPSMGEPEIVHDAIPPGASILELGAGAGRMTHPLVALGHPVVAVDESEEMLARLRGAAGELDADGSVGVETVQARIEELDLRRRFDAVVLASFLVNEPDDDLRGRFLRACRGHVGDDGCVLVQRHPPAWFDEAAEGERTSGGITFRLRDLARPEPGLLSATVEYQVGERVWTQWFTARRLDDAALAAALAEAGLTVDAYLTGDGSWVRAVPASRGEALGRSPR